MKGIIKGIFMLFFCFIYTLAMFTMAKIMGSLQKKLDTKGRRLSFSSWKSHSQKGKLSLPIPLTWTNSQSYL